MSDSFVLSADPGDTTGLALWTLDGELIWTTEKSLEELESWVLDLDIVLSIVIYEDFRLFRHKAAQQTGSRFGASQAIGMLKVLANRNSAKKVRQNSNILRIAGMHAGVKLPKGHIKDSVSAYLHGFYYFESVGIRVPILQDGRKADL